MRAGDFELYKISGERNAADLFKQFGLPPERLEMFLQLLGCNFADGRPASAPSLKVEGGLKIFQVDAAGAIAERRPDLGRLQAEEVVRHRRRYTTSHYDSREAWALTTVVPKGDSPGASVLGDSQRNSERAHTLQAPRRERWCDALEDFDVELPADELETILLSIRPSLPHRQLAEETAWQGGCCVPGTSPADQAQAASRQCLPHQQRSREEFLKVFP